MQPISTIQYKSSGRLRGWYVHFRFDIPNMHFTGAGRLLVFAQDSARAKNAAISVMGCLEGDCHVTRIRRAND